MADGSSSELEALRKQLEVERGLREAADAENERLTAQIEAYATDMASLFQEQHDRGKDGLAAVSVSLDDASDAETEKKVLRILQKQRADFTNVILKEEMEAWQKKLGIEGPPAVFVFGRDGKYKKFTMGEHYDKIEKHVAELLKEPTGGK